MFYKKLLATTALTITMASSVIAQDVTLSTIVWLTPQSGTTMRHNKHSDFIDVEMKGRV